MLKQSKIDGERRVFQDRSVCLHNTEKSFLCVRFARKQHRVFLQYYRLVPEGHEVSNITPTPSQSPSILSVLSSRGGHEMSNIIVTECCR